MKSELEQEVIAVMSGMYNLQEKFNELPIKERIKHKDYIQEINNRSGAMLFHMEDYIEKMERDGMDIVNELRNAGAL